MSQENQSQARNEGGPRRQGNRNRNNQGRKNQGGNRNNRNNRGSNQQGRQNGGGPKNPQRRHQRKPLPLTTWEKILKFFGLYKEPTRPPRRQSAGQTGETETPKGKKSPKANTRNARGKSSAQGEGRREKRNYPVETPRLYLGNLSYDADESALEELFKGVGTVRSVEIVYNRHTHRSKGFGFIEMQSVDEAKRAVEELHDKQFMGRNLVVNGANNKPKEDRPPRERKPRERTPRENKPTRERGEKRNRPTSKSRLHVDNLSYDVDESSLEELFKGVGNVRRVEIVYSQQTHRSKGFGFVEMQKTEDLKRAIEVLHDQPFMGRKLVVTEASNTTPKENSTPKEKTTEEKAQPTAPVKSVAEEAPVVEETPVVETPEETPVKVPEVKTPTSETAPEPVVETATEPISEPVAETVEPTSEEAPKVTAK
jgi:RNA recognition motif-containing protein